jgi:guanosine-3',5'-bis(diphosphate) 3'-pyrophosphohydrolase
LPLRGVEGKLGVTAVSETDAALAGPRLFPSGGGISDVTQLLTALQFAARKHRTQRRKDVDASPYINHPIDVATVLATRGRIRDLPTLLAAILHDTIEDTETTAEELEREFGAEVRALVIEVSDDKRLPKAERRRRQVEHSRLKSLKAKVIKLGDKIANVRDLTLAPPHDWSIGRRREFLDWTEQVVKGCRGSNPELERYYDEVLWEGRLALEA